VFPAAVVNPVNAEEPKKPGILRPTDQSVLDSEEVQIIARAGEIALDGKSLNDGKMQSNRQLLTVRIPAGRHELVWKNGDAIQTIQFWVRSSGKTAAPPGWKVYRAHPPQAQCQHCHASEQPGDFSKTTVAETCFTCHEQKTFAAGHAHNDEVLNECVLCHNPHGSTERFHLKMTRETACKQCHG
jgi:predicted CXXCH cytochrome family protein